MTPDFNKIQAGLANGLQKTTRVKKEERTAEMQQDNGIAFKSVDLKDMGTGVAGRSSVKMDNFETDLAKFRQNYDFAQATNKYIDSLLEQGYSLEEAISAVHNELGIE